MGSWPQIQDGEPVDVGMDDAVDPQEGGPGGGTTDHRELDFRSSANQHPIGAIDSLQAALDSGAHVAIVRGFVVASGDIAATLGAQDDGQYVIVVNSGDTSLAGTYTVTSGVGVRDTAQPAVNSLVGVTLLKQGDQQIGPAALLVLDGAPVFQIIASSIDPVGGYLEVACGSGETPITVDSFGRISARHVHITGVGSSPALTIPEAADCAQGQFIMGTADTAATNAPLAYTLRDFGAATPGQLVGTDGWIQGNPDTDYSGGNSATVHTIVDGNPVDAVFSTVYADALAVLADFAAQIGATFELVGGTNPTLTSTTTGTGSSLQIVSVDLDGTSNPFLAATDLHSGLDNGTQKVGIGRTHYLLNGVPDPKWENLLWEPEVDDEEQLSFIIIASPAAGKWLPILMKPNIDERITSHDDEARVHTDDPNPLNGPGFGTYLRTNVRTRLDNSEHGARFALGRTIDANDSDVTVLDRNAAQQWTGDEVGKIVRLQVDAEEALALGGDVAANVPVLAGKNLITWHTLSAGRAMSLPLQAGEVGATAIVKADSSVVMNNGTVSGAILGLDEDDVPIIEPIDQPGGAATTFVVTLPGVYWFEHFVDGWALAGFFAY